MNFDPLLDISTPLDSVTLEKAVFCRKLGIWKESLRTFIARYSWNADNQLLSIEELGGAHLYAYDSEGRMSARYFMDKAGKVTEREIFEWDDNSRLISRRLKSDSSPEERLWLYRYDDAGRMRAERCKDTIRIEKYNSEGLITEEYHYEGNSPDLITEYVYNDQHKVVSIIIRSPEGTCHRRTDYVWNAENQLKTLCIRDCENRIIQDERYAYGASHGSHWLERVTWVSNGRRNGKQQPRDVIYRSFTFGSQKARSEYAEMKSIAFANGVYYGPVLGTRPEGAGVFQYNDESCYEGEFRNGAMQGSGKLTWSDGREIEGSFSNGFLEGQGRCSWADGSRYEGDFRQGRMEGTGIFTWSDGTRFEGLFEDGKRTDQGIWQYSGE